MATAQKHDMTNVIFCYKPEPAGLWLIVVFPLDYGDVEVNPEEDVDDEDGNEGLGKVGDFPSAPFQLHPDISPYHQANA